MMLPELEINCKILAVKYDVKANEHAEKAINYAIRSGEQLIKIKKELNHGEFSIWIRKNMKSSIRQCQSYIKIFSNLELIKTKRASFLENLSIREAIELIDNEKQKVSSEKKEKCIKEKYKTKSETIDIKKIKFKKPKAKTKKKLNQEITIKESLSIFGLGCNATNETSLKAIYKCYSKIYHPDKGGDEEKMKQLNLAYDKLKQDI